MELERNRSVLNLVADFLEAFPENYDQSSWGSKIQTFVFLVKSILVVQMLVLLVMLLRLWG